MLLASATSFPVDFFHDSAKGQFWFGLAGRRDFSLNGLRLTTLSSRLVEDCDRESGAQSDGLEIVVICEVS
jgi:hypothetical protein